MKSLIFTSDEDGPQVAVDGIVLDRDKHCSVIDAKNALLTQLAEQKHNLTPADWHALGMILVRGTEWRDVRSEYDESNGYFIEEYVRIS